MTEIYTEVTLQSHDQRILRILDANINRLREALRVIEEHYRFILGSEKQTHTLKTLRHELIGVQQAIGVEGLVQSRDTHTDPLGYVATQNECSDRESADDILRANFKRAQEAARVIEEYTKVLQKGDTIAAGAKRIRFVLYEFEKKVHTACNE